MIGNGTKVDSLDARRITLEMADAAAKASRKALRMLAKEQQRLIDDGLKPDGSRQEQNTKKKAKEKKGKPPLWDTGRLRNPKTWSIKHDRGDGKMRIRPPKDRESVIAILYALHNYVTVFHELPASFDAETQALLDEAMGKVKT